MSFKQPKTRSFNYRYPPMGGNGNSPSIHNTSQKSNTSAFLINFDSQFTQTRRYKLNRTMSDGRMTQNPRNVDKSTLLNSNESLGHQVVINTSQPQTRHKLGGILRSNTHPLRQSLVIMNGENIAGTGARTTAKEHYGSINCNLRETYQLDTDRMAMNVSAKRNTGLRRNNGRGSCRPPLPGARRAIRASMMLAQESINYHSDLHEASRRSHNSTQRRGYDARIYSPMTPQIYSSTSKATSRNAQHRSPPTLPDTLLRSRTAPGSVPQGIRRAAHARLPRRESRMGSSSGRSSSPEVKGAQKLRNQYLYLEQRESRRSEDTLEILVDRILVATKLSWPYKSPRPSSQLPVNADVEIKNVDAHKRVKIVGFKANLTMEGIQALLDEEDSRSVLFRRERSVKGEICPSEREGCVDALKRGWTKTETLLKIFVSLEKVEPMDLDIYRDERQNRFDRGENWDTGLSRRRNWDEKKKGWRRVIGLSHTR